MSDTLMNWELQQKKDILEGIEKLRDVNNASGHAKLVDAVRVQHRTHQQNLMRSFLVLVENWARDFDSGRYDARNEATCRLSKEIIEIKDRYLPFI
jgi:hypothetical protein